MLQRQALRGPLALTSTTPKLALLQPAAPRLRLIGSSCGRLSSRPSVATGSSSGDSSYVRVYVKETDVRPEDDPNWQLPTKGMNAGLREQQDQQRSATNSQRKGGVDPTISIDPANYSSGFVGRRLLCFSGLLLGYMGLYFTRGSLTYVAPVLVADPTLGINMTHVGALASAFPLAYGVSKFAGGVMGAKFSPTKMIGLGLLATAVINLAFGFMGSSVTALTALWFLNGSLQGIGAPASTILLTRWFATKERGTYWGLWNVGANMGGFLTSIVVGYVAKAYGWQWGMWVPGIIGTALAFWALAVVRDSPEEAGYLPTKGGLLDEGSSSSSTSTSYQASSTAAAVVKDASEAASASGAVTDGQGASALNGRGFSAAQASSVSTNNINNAVGSSASPGPSAQEQKDTENKEKNNSMMAAFKEAASSRGVQLLALSYFCLYVVRQGATSWLVFYLLQAKGAADAGAAAATVSGMELGGLAGGVIAGALSDRFITKAKDGAGHVGKRVKLVIGYLIASLGVLAALRVVPAEAKGLQWACIAALGFTIYGPHMLIGLCGAELVARRAVGASQGILGLIAYIGAANAGIPLSHIVKNFGWDAYFTTLAAAAGVAILLLMPLVNAQSFVQKHEAEAQKLA